MNASDKTGAGQGAPLRRRDHTGRIVMLALLTVAAAGCGAPDPAARPLGAAGTASPTAAASPSTAPSSSAAPAASHSPTPAPAKAPAVPATARTITVVNAVDQTIWVATDRNKDHPLPVTGWRLEPGQSTTFTVNDKWGGRIWGRTGCTFNGAGKGHCATGDCAGVFQCTGSGATPATLAELTLDAWSGLDFYDVSLVDGANLPMYINIGHTTTKDPVSPTGCSAGGCTKPVLCPTAMQVTVDGRAVACTTPCAAFGGDAYCCRGAWAGRENCIPSKWPVDYTQVFKKAEPYAYSYAFDDSATMSCKGGCSYRITFGVTP
jgi:hypothetical protein